MGAYLLCNSTLPLTPGHFYAEMTGAKESKKPEEEQGKTIVDSTGLPTQPTVQEGAVKGLSKVSIVLLMTTVFRHKYVVHLS